MVYCALDGSLQLRKRAFQILRGDPLTRGDDKAAAARGAGAADKGEGGLLTRGAGVGTGRQE